jgi:hypothetical protein
MRYVEATAPAVIDEGLSRACIQLLQPKEHSQTGVELESQRNATATKQATLPFGEVECLMFSFKSGLRRHRRAHLSSDRSRIRGPRAARGARPRALRGHAERPLVRARRARLRHPQN